MPGCLTRSLATAQASDYRRQKMKPFHTLIFLSALLLMQPAGAAQSTLDSIVAIVNESVITHRELENRISLIKIDFSQSNRRLPAADVLQRQVLESLINNSLLLQEASLIDTIKRLRASFYGTLHYSCVARLLKSTKPNRQG